MMKTLRRSTPRVRAVLLGATVLAGAWPAFAAAQTASTPEGSTPATQAAPTRTGPQTAGGTPAGLSPETSPVLSPRPQDTARPVGPNGADQGDTPLPNATPPAPGAAPDTGAPVQEVVVTGYRRSLTDAASNKRRSTNFTDSIYAEDIGKFPDLNIAESLQRVPGVQLARDTTGEGVQISVRGLGPSFTKILLNGSQIAVASDGSLDSGNSNREVDLDLFPTELFTKLTINKTPTADLVEGGISGTVNLVNARPFDNPGQHVSFSYQEGYSDAANRGSPRGALIASKTWDKVGILVGVAGSALNYRSDGFETIGYTSPNLVSPLVGDCTVATCDRVGVAGAAGGQGFRFPTTVPNNTGFGLTPGAPLNVAQTSGLSDTQLSNTLLPRLAREAYDQGSRDRYSTLFAAEYRPFDNLHFNLDALYSHADRDFNRLDMDLIVRNSGPTGGPPAAQNIGIVPINWQTDSLGYLQKGTLANAQFFLEARPYTETVDFYNINPSFSYKPTDWIEIDGQVNYNRSLFTRVANSYLFDTPPNSGLSVDFDNSQGGDFPVITPSADLNNPALGWVNDSYRIQREKRVTVDKGTHWDATFGNSANNIKVGYAYDETDREILSFDNSTLAQTTGLANIPNSAVGQYLAPGPANILGESGQAVGFPSFVQPIYGTLGAAANTAALTASAPFASSGAVGSTPSGFIDEITNGGYVEANGVADYLNFKIHFNGGVRYFRTGQRVSGPITLNGVTSFQTTKADYDAFLPSFNMAIDLTKQLVLRLAGSRSITRANPNILLPGTVFSDPSAQVATQGNPNLKPYFSDNEDIGLEYYTGGPGYISFDYFNKDISGFTATTQVSEPFSALGIPLSALSTPQLATGINLNTLIAVNTQTNINSNLSIRGEEIIYSQPLDILTRRLPFHVTGFGFTGNYTHIDQSTNGGGSVATGIAPNIYTLGGYFENYGVSVHLDYTYTDSLIAATAPQNNVGQPIVADARGQVDLSSSYTLPFFNKAMQVTFNAININNAPIRTYLGDPKATYSAYFPGPSYYLGLRARF